jgi:cytochrome c-type biogenesis protein
MNGPGAFPIAFGAGLVSFLSPCTLPLIPGYLSYISGIGAEEIRAGEKSNTLFATACLFVLGFALVFVAIGATASYIGSLVRPYHSVLTRTAGVFIIVMALVMVGLLKFPIFYGEKRFHPRRQFGVWSAFPLGMAFGFGWSPCIGPILGSIFALAATQSSAQRGALLLFVYALGLGAPFLLVALFAGRALTSLGWFKRHYQAITLMGSSLLMFMGVFLIMDRWTQLLSPVLNWYSQLNLPT